MAIAKILLINDRRAELIAVEIHRDALLICEALANCNRVGRRVSVHCNLTTLPLFSKGHVEKFVGTIKDLGAFHDLPNIHPTIDTFIWDKLSGFYALFSEKRDLVSTPGVRGPDLTRRIDCLLYTSPSPRDGLLSRMPSSA